MASVSMTNEQRLAFIKSQAPQDLIVAMESLADTLSSVVDIRREPAKIFDPTISEIAFDYALEGVDQAVDKFQYEDGATIWLESMTDDVTEASQAMSMKDAHIHNLRQLMENSVMEARTAHPNQRN